jgi:hypothetical protein|tara:strand:+ start:32 stop:196 length:165 start_codon:yes stop_codon:yes gene_type:complete
MKEEEYSVSIVGSWGVMAESRESAEQYILDQFGSGNTNYTGDVEISFDEEEETE